MFIFWLEEGRLFLLIGILRLYLKGRSSFLKGNYGFVIRREGE